MMISETLQQMKTILMLKELRNAVNGESDSRTRFNFNIYSCIKFDVYSRPLDPCMEQAQQPFRRHANKDLALCPQASAHNIAA
eukprot:SAG22_NODE_7105_length_776_cov_0.741507_1_plen_83_part_10